MYAIYKPDRPERNGTQMRDRQPFAYTLQNQHTRTHAYDESSFVSS